MSQKSQTQKCQNAYSITSSALASSVEGMVSPSVLAVLTLMTSSNLIGLHDRQIRRFNAFDDLPGIDSDLAIHLAEINAVAHQASSRDVFPKRIHGGYAVARRQRVALLGRRWDMQARENNKWRTPTKRTSLRKAWKAQPAGPARRLPSRPAASDRLRPIRRRELGKLPLTPERKLLAQVRPSLSKTSRRCRTLGALVWKRRLRSWGGLPSSLVARSAYRVSNEGKGAVSTERANVTLHE